jgi:hypothetical protein
MSKRRRAGSRSNTDLFWGTASTTAEATPMIRPNPDPGALALSLGDPPLGGHSSAVQNHLAVVYEQAVRAATALAAANGILDDESVESG